MTRSREATAGMIGVMLTYLAGDMTDEEWTDFATDLMAVVRMHADRRLVTFERAPEGPL